MSVILELSLPADEFELGCILDLEEMDSRIVLETMVPLEGQGVPFIRFLDDESCAFEARVRRHPAVSRIQQVADPDGETLYALDWEISEGTLFYGMETVDACLLKGVGTARSWSFQLRLPTRDHVSSFQEYCDDWNLDFEIERLYRPTSGSADKRHGLTPIQRKTLVTAVQMGYYAVPREISTEELAEEFGISAQATSERLRRAVDALARHTLMLSEDNPEIRPRR
jgi:hypothetical protein